MKKKYVIILFLIITCRQTFSQNYPTFGPEIPVNIIGLSLDAMEPSISANGNYLFINNINDGVTTSLYYATKVNDSTFTFAGVLSGASQTITPRLDAVASSDSSNRFYWTSLRDFPTQFDNYFHGTFNGTDVVNISRLHGTFYIYAVGWLMMDAEINYDGNLLYYTNAYFGPTYAGCGGGPCQGKLGVALKQNDSTFNKLNNSDVIMQNINDTNYVVYAPNISKNELELFYTRFLKSNISLGTQICVSVRTNLADTFSLPSIIHPFSALTPEATTLTSDQSKIYYHKKNGGIYKLFMRYRSLTTGINEKGNIRGLTLYPNPSNDIINVNLSNPNMSFSLELYSVFGQLLLKTCNNTIIDISNFTSGIYTLIVKQENKIWKNKIIKQ
jgi:hypothetical protein